jgi:hypothetical protein
LRGVTRDSTDAEQTAANLRARDLKRIEEQGDVDWERKRELEDLDHKSRLAYREEAAKVETRILMDGTAETPSTVKDVLLGKPVEVDGQRDQLREANNELLGKPARRKSAALPWKTLEAPTSPAAPQLTDEEAKRQVDGDSV